MVNELKNEYRIKNQLACEKRELSREEYKALKEDERRYVKIEENKYVITVPLDVPDAELEELRKWQDSLNISEIKKNSDTIKIIALYFFGVSVISLCISLIAVIKIFSMLS